MRNKIYKRDFPKFDPKMLKFNINKQLQVHFQFSLNGAACKKNKIAISFRILDWDALFKLALLRGERTSLSFEVLVNKLRKKLLVECDYQGQ